MTHKLSLYQCLSVWIGSASERGARLLAPATPWLFLGLRRALIPTLCWAFLALMFFVVPQSREVLHGMSEPPLQSVMDFKDEVTHMVNVWTLTSYVTTAVLVALALWYSARLLITVESGEAVPRALADPQGERRLRFASTWFPRIVGVSTLAAAVGAMVYANYTPGLSQAEALGWVFALIGGAILFSAGTLSVRRGWRTGGLVLLIAGILLYGVSVIALYFQAKWRVWAWSIVPATFPALLLVFLVKRRDLLARMKMDTGGESSAGRRFGEVVVTTLGVVGAGIVGMLLLALSPPYVVRGFGSAASVLLFLAALALLLTAVQLVVRRLARDVPGLTTAGIVGIALLVAAVGQESLGTEKLAAAKDTAPASAATVSSGAGNSSGGVASPRTYVNAYGGGLRAAIFTAEVLAQADDVTCGEFGQQIAALSGVSGGSLGIATYVLARQEHIGRGGWKECKGGPEASTPLTNLVTKALVHDHLSPVIARMLAVDAPHIPGALIRGQALLDSWQGALMDALKEGRSAPGLPRALDLPLGELTGGRSPSMRVYFNSTNADTGHITWFSNEGGGKTGNNVGGEVSEVESMSVGQAVLHSARFPFVSPAGSFRSGTGATPSRLVDGGYADNSGATTLLSEFRSHPASGLPGPGVFIDIDGNAPGESLCFSTSGTPPLLTALRALLQARSAHATLAVKNLSAAMKVEPTHVRLDLEEVYQVAKREGADRDAACDKVRRAQHAPLGWYVSYGAAQTMAASAQLGMRRVVDAVGAVQRQAMPSLAPAK